MFMENCVLSHVRFFLKPLIIREFRILGSSSAMQVKILYFYHVLGEANSIRFSIAKDGV